MNIPLDPDTFEQLLRRYLLSIETDQASAVPAIRQIVADEKVLPVMFDWGGFWAITLESRVVFYEFGDDCKTAILRGDESSIRMRNSALYSAGTTYPELRSLIPSRSNDDVTCLGCDGIGRVRPEGSLKDASAELMDRLVCYCGGLGWVPSDDQFPSYQTEDL